jgi:hypothetical protein
MFEFGGPKDAQTIAEVLGLPADRVISIGILGEIKILCSGRTKYGMACTAYAKKFAGNVGYCSRHIPPGSHPRDLTDSPKHYFDIEAAAAKQRALRILNVYKVLAPLRIIPPPEDLAFYFLRAIQNDGCFMCRIMDDPSAAYPHGQHLVEDHDHDSGMVRSMLCRNCNISEPYGDSLVWRVYRRFHPAKGWHYRYYGMGAQWAGQADPVLNRISGENIGLTKEFCARHPLEGLARYIKFVEQTRDRHAIKIRRYRFDQLNRLYWEGQPGFEVNERDELLRRCIAMEKLSRSMRSG